MLWYWPEGTLQYFKVGNFHKNRIARSYRLILHTVGPSLSALVNTKFDSPIPTAWNVASVFEIFEQKRFASCGQLWQSVPKTEPPLAPTALLYAEQDLSPLGIIIMRLGRGTQISKLSKLHWLDWLCRKRKGKCQDFICSWHSSPWTTCHLHLTLHPLVTSSQTQNVGK